MSTESFDIESVLQEVRLFLPRLIEACDSAADAYYYVPSDEAWSYFGEVVQGMDDLYRTMQSVNEHLKSTQSNVVFQETVDYFIAKMASKFTEMNRNMDEENYIEAADVIKYELVKLFYQLAERLGESKQIRNRRYSVNLSFLEKNFPHVFQEVKDIVPDEERYELFYSQNGAPNLSLPGSGDRSIHLHSQYDVHHEAKRWVEAMAPTILGKTNVLLYGLGFGYHLDRITEVNKLQQFYVYEPDVQIFIAAMHAIELEPLFSRTNIKDLAVGQKKQEIEQYFYRFLRKIKGETITISLPAYDRIAPVQKRKFIDDAKMAILNYAFSKSAHQKLGIQWTKNRMLNMAVNIDTPSLLGLKDKLEGIPAVIVGAGPSLEADIEHLKQMKNHALIIAAGSSIQSLLHYGVEPHLIVNMDGDNPNYVIFQNLDTDHIPFLYAPQVEHRIIENKTSLTMHAFLANDLVTQVLMGVTHEDPVFASNHSVSGTAIQAAIYMGCKEIIFTGQDASYPGNVVYSKGAKHLPQEYTDRVLQVATIMVENVQGGFNRTTDSLKLVLGDIEDLLAQHPEIRFINCSGLGAKIEHTTFLPMSNVLENLQDRSLKPDFFLELMKEHLRDYSDSRKQAAIARVFEAADLLQVISGKLDRIRSQLNKLPELSRTKPLKCMNAMVAIEEDWESIVKGIMFNTLYITAMENEVNAFDRDVAEVAKESDIVKKAELFRNVLGPLVDKMKERTPEFIEMIEETTRRIQTRSQKTSEVLR